jgi:hypothetical protein
MRRYLLAAGVLTLAIGIAWSVEGKQEFPGKGCWSYLVGGANRHAGCTAIPGCHHINNVCIVNNIPQSVGSADSDREYFYQDCKDWDYATCVVDNSLTCRDMKAYKDENCQVYACMLYVIKYDCHTEW